MRRVLVALLVVAGAAAAEPAAWNQTAVRERWNTIITIDGDLRRDGVATRAALPLPTWWCELRLAYQAWPVAWDARSPVAFAQANPPSGGEVLRERRQELTLSWRQDLGTPWLSLETVAHGARDDRTDDAHLGDLETNLVVPIWLQRYQAVSIAAGSLAPIEDESQDWIRGHGSWSDRSWTGLADLRGGCGIGLATLQARVGGEWTPHGHNRLPDHGDRLADRFVRLDDALALTMRFTRWLRLGAEQDIDQRRWSGRGATRFATTRVTSAPLLARLELTPRPGSGLFVEAWGGIDLATRATLGSGDSIVAGVALTLVP